jgi:hypothetical protein
MTHRDLTADERAALQRFADRENCKADPWKDRLCMVYWYNARLWEGGQPGDGSLLHGLRNTFGPTWLYDVCDVRPTPKPRRDEGAQPRSRHALPGVTKRP